MRSQQLEDFLKLQQNYGQTPAAKRLMAQLGFLLEMSLEQDCRFDSQIFPVLGKVCRQAEEAGAITQAIADAAEKELALLGAEAKQYEATCVAHAHIDMNWMWGYHETAALTIDTFSTMLDLLDEYPQFTFAQSQASVYEIVERFHPEMLERIRSYVQQGRWEVTASTWTENDKNMSGAEAMARHYLYTKQYLTNLLNLPEDALLLDFEPDTFGHNRNMPEILGQGGVKYYYHCRGFEGPNVYVWRAPSGAEVLVYREPAWYNEGIDDTTFIRMPAFCKRSHTKKLLKVYGVGDHGGGPSRRDIERLLDMQQWPLYPVIKFGTYQGYFKSLEAEREKFPVVEHELNYIFTGCYTSQSRIKRANLLGESRLQEAEALDVAARAGAGSYKTASPFESAWRRVLFSQFHDILPGSGVADTRDYALGQFQESMAVATVNANHAMRSLNAAIDTSKIEVVMDEGLAQGAGVGYAMRGANAYVPPQTSHVSGTPRIFTLHNPTACPREEVVPITLWDWCGNDDNLGVYDMDGQELPSCVTEKGKRFWGHGYHIIAVQITIPAFGYTCCVVKNKVRAHVYAPKASDYLCDKIHDNDIVLENDKLRAVFCGKTARLLGLESKATGKQYLSARHPAEFVLVTENPAQGMTSWRVGKTAQTVSLHESRPVYIKDVCESGILPYIEYEIPGGDIGLKVRISLPAGATALACKVTADWQLVGSPTAGIPQLRFQVPTAFRAEKYRCAIPYGYEDRPALQQDVPCTGCIAPLPVEGEESVYLCCDGSYGYRGCGNAVSVNLIRGSYDPDPYPENGIHDFALSLGVAVASPAELYQATQRFLHPVYAVANSSHKGSLPSTGSVVSVSGGVIVQSMKPSEDGRAVVLRLFNPEKTEQRGCAAFMLAPRAACVVNFLEKQTGTAEIEGKNVHFACPGKAVLSLRVELEPAE